MAIQTVNTGSAPNDGTGDNLRAAYTKLNNNFTDTTNAASKLVGTASDEVPLNSDLPDFDDFITDSPGRTQQQRIGIYHGVAGLSPNLPLGWSSSTSSNIVTVTHNLGNSNYTLIAQDYEDFNLITGVAKSANSFSVTWNSADPNIRFDFSLLLN